MKQERRWLKSVLAASESSQVSLPWQRGTRLTRACPKKLPAAPNPRAIAAR